jgi:hypothetical protein
MISNTRLITPNNLLRNKYTTRTRCNKYTGDFLCKVKLLNDEDNRIMYENTLASLLKNHPGISMSSIDGLTCKQLNSICVHLDYIQEIYVKAHKFGYLTQFDILSNNKLFSSVRVVDMTAKERIDARTTLANIATEFPKLESYCYNLMLELRVLGKD